MQNPAEKEKSREKERHTAANTLESSISGAIITISILRAKRKITTTTTTTSSFFRYIGRHFSAIFVSHTVEIFRETTYEESRRFITKY